MDYKKITAISLLCVSVLAFSFVASPDMVWMENRVFGLVSFFALFLTVLLGELRMITLVKGKFKLFRFHKPLGIFALSTVGFHFVTALLDRARWGASILAYLGLDFSDSWLIFLSFGALGMYLMITVAVTSARAAKVKLGYKNWKLIHYLSYASFIIAYIHAVNLGTDLKHSAAMVILKPLVMASMLIVVALAFTRVLVGFKKLQDQVIVYMTALTFLVLLLGSIIMAKMDSQHQVEVDSVNNALEIESQKLDSQSDSVALLKNETDLLKYELGAIP